MPRIIKDSLNLMDKGLMEIPDNLKSSCIRNNIPTLKGKLYEVDDFGNLIFKRSNTVVLGGSINAVEKLFGVFGNYRPKSLTMEKSLFPPTSIVPTYDEAYEKSIEKDCNILLFGCGTGGSAMEFTNVYAPDFKQNQIMDMIPFRVSSTTSLDVPGILPGAENKIERDKYHFMMPISNETNPLYGWYLKEFENPVEIKSLWKNAPDLSKDGTEILSDADVAGGPAGVGIETFGEIVIRFNPGDVTPYFEATGNIEQARYNSIGLFSGKKIQLSADYSEYYNVRLFSVVNIENVSVKRNRQSTYVYRVYSSL